MLPKSQRLRAQEVRMVLKEGRSKRATHLSMRYIATPTPLRTAAVVPKSVAKGAVERNRLRRALYRALREKKARGTAVFFVQKAPKTPLQPTFSADIDVLLSL